MEEAEERQKVGSSGLDRPKSVTKDDLYVDTMRKLQFGKYS